MRLNTNSQVSALAFAIFGAMSAAGSAALPDAHPGATVNDYTAAESGRAQAPREAAAIANLRSPWCKPEISS